MSLYTSFVCLSHYLPFSHGRYDPSSCTADLTFLKREGSQGSSSSSSSAQPHPQQAQAAPSRAAVGSIKTGGGINGGISSSSGSGGDGVNASAGGTGGGVAKLAQELHTAVLDLGERLGRVLERSKHPEVRGREEIKEVAGAV